MTMYLATVDCATAKPSLSSRSVVSRPALPLVSLDAAGPCRRTAGDRHSLASRRLSFLLASGDLVGKTQNPSGQSPCVIAAHRTFCLRYGKWTLKLCQLFTDAKPEASECCRKAANTEVPVHLSNNAGAIGRHSNLQIESLRLGCRQRPAGVAARCVRRTSLSSKG